MAGRRAPHLRVAAAELSDEAEVGHLDPVAAGAERGVDATDGAHFDGEWELLLDGDAQQHLPDGASGRSRVVECARRAGASHGGEGDGKTRDAQQRVAATCSRSDVASGVAPSCLSAGLDLR